MRIATLFSGIGAPEQGVARVYPNHEVIFACEFDKFARQSYEANYDLAAEHFHKDVHDLDATQYQGKVDILIGGSPCQAFSLAGMRHGTEDERGQLIYQYIRVVEECKPEIIVYENVKGMMSITGGRTIKEFVQALRDIGYHCHYGVINTKDYGVPQNRERLYLVGFLDADLYHKFHFADKQPLIKRLKDVLEDDVDEKYYLSDKAVSFFKQNSINNEKKGNGFRFSPQDGSNPAKALTTLAGSRMDDNFIKVAGTLSGKGHDLIKRVYSTDGISRTLTAVSGGGHEPKIQVLGHSGTGGQRGDIISPEGISSCLTATDYKQPKQIEVPSATKSGYETATTGDSINLSVPNSKTRRGRVGKQVAQTLDTACNQAVVEPMIYDDYNGKLKTDGIACSLTTNCGASAPRNGQKVVTDRIRKLTPRECLRLQDFPESFKQVVSASQMYKQAGNSMSVNILEMIFLQINKAKRGETVGLF